MKFDQYESGLRLPLSINILNRSLTDKPSKIRVLNYGSLLMKKKPSIARLYRRKSKNSLRTLLYLVEYSWLYTLLYLIWKYYDFLLDLKIISISTIISMGALGHHKDNSQCCSKKERNQKQYISETDCKLVSTNQRSFFATCLIKEGIPIIYRWAPLVKILRFSDHMLFNHI